MKNGLDSFAQPTDGADPVTAIRAKDKEPIHWIGMTKREYFAAMAASAIVAANWEDRCYEDVAKSAVTQADALIKELNK